MRFAYYWFSVLCDSSPLWRLSHKCWLLMNQVVVGISLSTMCEAQLSVESSGLPWLLIWSCVAVSGVLLRFALNLWCSAALAAREPAIPAVSNCLEGKSSEARQEMLGQAQKKESENGALLEESS